MVRPAKDPDERMIEIFAAFLNTLGPPVFNIIEWPEDSGLDKQIDAIVGPLAIEHTSVDALPHQREMNVRFAEVVETIEADTKNRLGFRLRIDIPFRAIEKGLNRKKMQSAMRDWIKSKATSLPDGLHKGISVSGLPFPICVVKGGPIETDGVIFARAIEDDPDISIRIRQQLDSKLAKLAKRRSRARKAVLLVASDDVALMTPDYFQSVFDAAYPQWPPPLDELWFAHRISKDEVVFSDIRTNQNWLHDILRQRTQLFG